MKLDLLVVLLTCDYVIFDLLVASDLLFHLLVLYKLDIMLKF